MSTCQEALLKTGKRISFPYHEADWTAVPAEFASLGLAWWWGVVQAYMFRFQPPVRQFIDAQAALMDDSRGFPYSRPVAGIHVRHGDKAVDGFHLHSLNAELSAVRKSPECHLQKESRHCKVDVNITATSEQNSSLGDAIPVQSHKTSDDNDLSLFVASDNPKVLAVSKSLGYLVDESGVSQAQGSSTMFTVLLSKHEIAYNATLEVIRDIHFLSHCSSLVGIAASQIYRMAVDMSNAHGRLKYCVAMDHNQLPKVMGMSAKFDLPVPEEFSVP
jgi:hypothetical protein